MDKKSLISVLIGYIMWGLLPLYWRLLANLSPIFVMSNRVIFSAIFTLAIIFLYRKRADLVELFKNKRVMKFLIPGSIFMTFNWGLYIWAVSSEHILDASLGYFMNPLAVFVCGVIFFRERFGAGETIALILALIGVTVTTVQAGEFPLVALTLAFSFSLYGVMKKYANVDGLLSVAIETIIMVPLALIYTIFAPSAHESIALATPLQLVLLVGAGIVTAVPLVLYSQGVQKLSLITLGFLQFISPILMFAVSIFEGEDYRLRIFGFVFIWGSLIVYVVDLIRKERKNGKVRAEQALESISD